MKTCPVCHAKAFDDAELCYGCLHRFGEAGVADGSSDPCMLAESTPPAFLIRFTPETNESGVMTWNCAVEVA